MSMSNFLLDLLQCTDNGQCMDMDIVWTMALMRIKRKS